MSDAPGRSMQSAAAPSPAVAPPPGNPRFALFDSLRGIAAVAIVLFHVGSLTGLLEQEVVGDAVGVAGPRSLTLFFVISGFLLYRPFVAARASNRRPPRLARYLRRRVLRIVPAYWVALTLLAIFPGIVGVFTGDWWRYYFFLALYSQDTVDKGIPVTWSLCVEVMFYFLLPLWALAVRRVSLGAGRWAWLRGELVALGLVGLIGATVQVLADRQQISELLGSSLAGQCLWLALGMTLAVLSVAVRHASSEPRVVRLVIRHPSACWLGAAACFVGLMLVLEPGGFFGLLAAVTTVQPFEKTLGGIVLTAGLVTFLVLPAVFGEDAGGLPRKLLASRPIAWLGVVSYGLFLWHLPIAQFLALDEDPAHFSASGLGLAAEFTTATTLILFPLTLAVTCVFAALSYYVVELPFLKLKETAAHPGGVTAPRRSAAPRG